MQKLGEIRLFADEAKTGGGLGSLWKAQSIHSAIPLCSLVGTGFICGKQVGFGDYEQSVSKKRTS
jgi:hypothetical protein